MPCRSLVTTRYQEPADVFLFPVAAMPGKLIFQTQTHFHSLAQAVSSLVEDLRPEHYAGALIMTPSKNYRGSDVPGLYNDLPG